MHHEGEDSHLGGTAVVELDGELLVDGGLVPLGRLQLSSLDVGLSDAESNLDEANEGDDLEGAGSGNGVEGGEAGLHGGEGNAVSDVTRKSDARRSHEVAEDGEHRDAAVLGLHVAEALEALLVSILQQAKGVPESKRSLSTNGILVRHLEAGAL